MDWHGRCFIRNKNQMKGGESNEKVNDCTESGVHDGFGYC